MDKQAHSSTRRRATLGIVAVLVVVGATAAAITLLGQPGSATTAPRAATPQASASSATTALVSTVGFPTGPGQVGIFTDRCRVSHEAADDPILAPGQPGAAMHHDFYGNTSTSAASTAASLVGGATTCTTSADASAYWTPVLYLNGAALTPGPALIYWRRPATDTDAVQTMPVGMQLIAGDETATAPQSTAVTAWTCTDQTGLKSATPNPHACADGSNLRLTVTFPSCWDGHSLIGRGQTNVVYRTPGGCPSSHPIQIPQIVFHVNYPTSSAAGLTVSMTPTMAGSTDTEHVDFINGWTQATFNADEAACVATSTRCGPVVGTQATPQGPSPATVRKRAAKMKAGKMKATMGH
jgi:hypothetical protein